MPKTTLDQIKATDPNLITQVVRADVGRPAFFVTDWSVRPLSNNGLMNQDGLFLLEGHGTDGSDPNVGVLPWNVVVKTANTPERETAPDNMWFWKREVLWFQSGLWEQMPGLVCGPRCFRVAECGGVWQMWMEHIRNSTPLRWNMEHYRQAAWALGRWNGRCFLQGFRPAVPWMSRELWRGPWEWGITIPGWRDYSSPFLRKAITAGDFDRACQVFDDFECYSAALNGLPQVFSHGDYHRRNLMIRKAADGRAEVVAVDWTMEGMGPLGGALYTLIGTSATLYEVEPEDLPALEAVVYPAYLAGLHDEGWEGDPAQIRLAYCAWLGLWMGAMGPAFIAGFTAPENAVNIRRQFGCEQEEFALGWGKLVRFALDRADEAKRLMAG